MELTLPAQQTPINYNVNVEDNFMPLDWCQEVFNELTHVPGRNAYFPWYCAEILSPNAPQSTLNCHPLKNVHFSHNFYHYGNSCSDYGHLIQPLIDKINPDVLYRAKANLNLYDEQPIKHGYHIDESFNGLTSILYLNTCDGSTSFKVGEEIVDVDAVQGRFITFDNRMLHSGSSTSNANSRVVFVINYYKHEVALQLGPEPIRITIPE